MFRREAAEIFFRQLEQSHRRPQAPPVFRVRRMLEIFLKMNERARSLDQSLEKTIVVALGVEPNLFQDIVGFVVTLLVPAPKIGAIKRMVGDLAGKIGVVAFEVAHEMRNSFAFVHEAFNFTIPPMMGKPTFPEGIANLRCHKQE